MHKPCNEPAMYSQYDNPMVLVRGTKLQRYCFTVCVFFGDSQILSIPCGNFPGFLLRMKLWSFGLNSFHP